MFVSGIVLFVYSLLGVLLALLLFVQTVKWYGQLGNAAPVLVVLACCLSVFFSFGIYKAFTEYADTESLNWDKIEAIRVFQQRYSQPQEHEAEPHQNAHKEP